MPSQITTTSNIINTLYPVAGVDNDSQGFRDNFNYIQTSFTQAAYEITNLQLYSVQTNTATNFNGNFVSNAVFSNNADSVDAYAGYGTGAWGQDNNILNNASPTITYGTANYFVASISTSTQFNIQGWPQSGTVGKLRFELVAYGVVNSATWNVSFNTDQSLSTASIYFIGNIDKGTGVYPTVYQPGTRQIWDVWSSDAGYNIWAQLVGTWNANV